MTDWVQKQLERIRQEQAEADQKGGPGSGHFGHAGRPGKQGGSQPGKGGGGGASSAPRGAGGKRTAASAYDEHSQAIGKHIGGIRSALTTHAAEQKKSPKSWGGVGDLDYVRAQLGEVLDSIQQVDEGTNWDADMMQREAVLDRTRGPIKAYQSRQAYIKKMLTKLDAGLKKDRREWEGSDKRDWGYAGYLADVESWLKDIDDFLNQRD